MHLTSEQIAAAEISGCSFRPATPAEVQRLSMQRRIFFIDGLPVLATRGDGFFETVGTLEKLIAEGRPVLQARAAAVPRPVAAPEPELLPMAAPDPVPRAAFAEAVAVVATEAIAAVDEEAAAEVAVVPPVVRIRRPRMPKPTRALFEPEPCDEAPLASAEAPETDPALRPSRSAVRARENPNPRWMTAGAARRGRATVHWSSRAR